MKEYYRIKADKKLLDRTITYNIFGKDVTLPKGFTLGTGTGLIQNKKSIEEGFKILEEWFKNPTPENWTKLFGNRLFGRQIRSYLLGEEISTRKGTGLNPAGKKLFDTLKVKELIPKDKIDKIVTLASDLREGWQEKVFKTRNFIPMSEIEKTIRDFSGGDDWIKANPDSTKTVDNKNIWRRKATVIRSDIARQQRIGGFPHGYSNERKLWASLYRASTRGDRIKIVGEFADGKLPVDENLKIKWNLKNKDGVEAWKRVKFIDTQAPGKATFTFGKSGEFAKQIDEVFGKGFFDESTKAYNTQQIIGSQKIDGVTVKDIFREKILRNRLLIAPMTHRGAQNPYKADMIPTEIEFKKYLKKSAPGFTISEVHHPYGVGKDPYTTESAFRHANRALGKAERTFASGGDETKFIKELTRINDEIGGIRSEVGGVLQGSKATSGQQIFTESLKFVGKENLPKLKQILVSLAKTNEGGVCGVLDFKAGGGRIRFAAGSNCAREMEVALNTNPIKVSQDIIKLEETTPVLGKIKNVAKGFLGALGKWGPKVGKYGAIMAAGAVAQPLVKQFMNDDPSTYLTDPDQIKGMLLSTIEAQEQKRPRSEALDFAHTAGTVGATAAAVPGTGALYKYRRGLSEAKIPKAGPITEGGLTAGDYLSKHAGKDYGKLRAGAGVGMKLLSGMFTPAGLMATEPLRIAQKRREGESWGDIAKSPMTWMGPAFAPSMSKMATSGMKKGAGLARLLRLGIPIGALNVWNPVGQAILLASLGAEGMKQYSDYKRRRGFFASEDRLQT